MADYYPLLARAIAALPQNTGEARRTVYERARSALLAQLRGAEPPLPDEEVTRERLALEEAVRRIETEYAAMAAGGAPRAAAVAPERAPPPERPRQEAPIRQEPPVRPEPPVRAEPPARPEPPRYEGSRQDAPRAQLPRAEFPRSETSRPEPSRAEPSRFEPFLPRSAPEPTPQDFSPFDVPGDADIEDEDAPPPERAPAGTIRPGLTPRRDQRLPEPRPAELRSEPRNPAPGKGRAQRPPVEENAASGGGGRGKIILLAVALLVFGGAAALGYTQRDSIISFIRDMRAGTTVATREDVPRPAAPESTKSTDRIAQAQSDPARRVVAPGAGAAGQVAAVAQRAVLFEENPGGGQQSLQQFVGSVVWRAETVNPGNGLPPDTGIHATIEIADRKFKMDLSLRRNQDPSLPASHIIELQFDLPADFDLGTVANVPGMRAKASEAAQGQPLSGLAVRVTPGFFLIGLSALENERQRNLGLLITRNWVDLPIVFSNGRRGILVLEKGLPGDQAFRQAFSAWGLPLPPETPPGGAPQQ